MYLPVSFYAARGCLDHSMCTYRSASVWTLCERMFPPSYVCACIGISVCSQTRPPQLCMPLELLGALLLFLLMRLHMPEPAQASSACPAVPDMFTAAVWPCTPLVSAGANPCLCNFVPQHASAPHVCYFCICLHMCGYMTALQPVRGRVVCRVCSLCLLALHKPTGPNERLAKQTTACTDFCLYLLCIYPCACLRLSVGVSVPVLRTLPQE